MKSTSFNVERLFVPALILSASFHIVIIAAHVWLPSKLDVSILEAPNSLEVTVVYQPLVSVMEDEIVTEEIMNHEASQDIVFHNLENDDHVYREQSLERYVKTEISRSPSEIKSKKSDYRPSVFSQESAGAVTKAKPLMHVNPAPLYPKIARQRGWQGTVRLNVLVEKDGTPDRVRVSESSGHRVLDSAALKTVKRWKFSPAQSGDLRLSSKIIIPIQFTLVKDQ